EQVAEEALLGLRVPGGAGGVGVLAAVRARRVGLAVATPIRARRVWLPAVAAGRHVVRGAVGAVLGREHVLQLAVVEEDPPAVLALLDVHTLPVDRAHPPVAFGTSHAGQDRGGGWRVRGGRQGAWDRI